MLQVNISTSEKDMIIWLIIPHAEQLHAHMLFFWNSDPGEKILFSFFLLSTEIRSSALSLDLIYMLAALGNIRLIKIFDGA